MPAPNVIDDFLELTYKSGVVSKDSFAVYWKRLENAGAKISRP